MRIFLNIECGRWDDIERDFENGIAVDEKHPTLWYEMGRALMRLQRWGEAYSYLRVVAKWMPESSTVLALWGRCLFQNGKLDDAYCALRSAITIEPDYPVAWLDLGIVCDAQHSFDMALECFSTALKIDNRCEEAWRRSATTLWALGKNEAAINSARLCVELHDKSIEARIVLAGFLLESKDFAETLCVLNPIQNDDIYLIWKLRAEAHINCNEHRLALHNVELFLKLEKKSADAWFWKAKVLAYMGDGASSVDALVRAVRIDENTIKEIRKNNIFLDVLTCEEYRTIVGVQK